MTDLEAFRSPAQRPAVIDDTPGQTQPAGRRQRGVTVDHEGLLGIGADFAIHIETRRPSPLSRTAQGMSPVTNVPGQH
ncbi:hypothetical protein, partial [Streptomyces sp. NPDC048196]|uniref:hypothetical protein n=1 Tax=Streptomyces sp. NPDC048196 TaxID=3154712 RepID=UPI0033C67661